MKSMWDPVNHSSLLFIRSLETAGNDVICGCKIAAWHLVVWVLGADQTIGPPEAPLMRWNLLSKFIQYSWDIPQYIYIYTWVRCVFRAPRFGLSGKMLLSYMYIYIYIHLSPYQLVQAFLSNFNMILTGIICRFSRGRGARKDFYEAQSA